MSDRAAARLDALLAACQRRPWRASVVLGMVAALVVWGLSRTLVFQTDLASSAAAAAGAALAASIHLTRNARSWLDRAAPVVVVGALLTAVAALAPSSRPLVQATGNVSVTVNGGVTRVSALGINVLNATAPMDQRLVEICSALCVALAGAAFWPVRRRAEPSRVAEAVRALAALAAIVLPLPDAVPTEIAAVLRVLVPFECAVRSELPARVLVLAGTAAGVAAWIAIQTRGARVYLDLSHQPFEVETMARTTPWISYPAACAVVALAALLARRARSMTAVPLDHTILADLGKAVPGTVRVTAAAAAR